MRFATRSTRLDERFDDIAIEVISDEAEFIRISVREVLMTLVFTIAVVIGTMLLFFGALKPTLIPSTTIPVALVGVVAGIWADGFLDQPAHPAGAGAGDRTDRRRCDRRAGKCAALAETRGWAKAPRR